MRIKRLELTGFKSFCDRSIVDFSDPIVGIVGPNGCGKSNIVDAIRWCMGEQSAKHLRGQAMADVIFAGSDSRGPSGLAEVSLTFEDVGFSHETLELLTTPTEIDKLPEDDQDEGTTGGVATGSDSTSGEATSEDGDPLEDGNQAEVGDSEQTEVSSDPAGLESKTEAAEANTVEVGEIGSKDVESKGDETPEEEQEDPLAATKEVAKVLEDKPPAIDYSQYSEVTITRRLFRDGSSQYLLNKVPCRLRDITDFFLGTGVGTKAYSIIEQGRIGMIVSSKAGDRRHIIEEAAGITKFKSKKRAAERKLGQTRQNLLRVSDIVEELDKRMGSLRRQAQKAERYRRYKAEVKDIELWTASHQYFEWRGAHRVLASELADKSKALETDRAEFDAIEAGISARRADMAIEEKNIAGMQEELYELENKIKLAESKTEFHGKELKDIKERGVEAQVEIEKLDEQIKTSTEELNNSSVELEEISVVFETHEADKNQKEQNLQNAKNELDGFQTQLDDARHVLQEARAEQVRSETSRKSIMQRCEDAGARLLTLQNETSETNDRVLEKKKAIKKIEKDLTDLNQMRLDLGDKKESLEERKQELMDAMDNHDTVVDELHAQLSAKRSRLESLEEIQAKFEGFALGTKAVMEHAESGQAEFSVVELLADAIDVPAGMERAVEAALGDKLGAVVVESKSAALKAIDFLKLQAKGKAAFYAVDEMTNAFAGQAAGQESGAERISGSMNNADVSCLSDVCSFKEPYKSYGGALFQGIFVVENLEKAWDVKKECPNGFVVTKSGSWVDREGLVCGGHEDSAGASVLAQKREIRELTQDVESLNEKYNDASYAKQSTKKELKSVTVSLQALLAERHDSEVRLTSLENDLKANQDEKSELTQRTVRLNSEELGIKDKVQTFNREYSSLEESFNLAAERLESSEKAQLELTQKVTERQLGLETFRQELTETKIAFAQLGEKRASLETTGLRLKQSIADMEERRLKVQHESEEGENRLIDLDRELEELARDMEEDKERRNTDTLQFDDAKQVYEKTLGEVQADELSIRDKRKHVEELIKHVEQLQHNVRELENKQIQLSETVYEKYQEKIEWVASDFHLRPQVTEDERKLLVERKRVIGRMGSDINLTAIDEFDEISTRHEFLSTQRDDLLKAVGQLESAIETINKTSKKLFKETFEAINAKFIEMFPKLFRGGRARLRLTGGPDMDLLECGVEIMAQPPGKKNVTVDQLSGGEKALTAVALLFAIFLIKPSPFCILDEVDAPLDEANVDRYNQILREMTALSQFIVITHNKRTMSNAGRLYGVTMQEPGVSKLVTVNLSKVGKDAA